MDTTRCSPERSDLQRRRASRAAQGFSRTSARAAEGTLWTTTDKVAHPLWRPSAALTLPQVKQLNYQHVKSGYGQTSDYFVLQCVLTKRPPVDLLCPLQWSILT